MLLAKLLSDLDRAFKTNPAFQRELEKLLAIQPLNIDFKPFELNGSDGLVLTIIMQMAEFAEHL